jgi:hypothetical protein
MKNQVIEVLNLEHGKEVIAYWQSKDIKTTYSGNNTKFKGDSRRYYGVINGSFDCYSIYQCIEHKAEIIKLPEINEKTLPREMLVWNDKDKPEPRMVVWINPDKNHKTQCIAIRRDDLEAFKNGKRFSTWEWEHYKEIPEEPETLEMTMEEVCKELGRQVKIVEKHD